MIDRARKAIESAMNDTLLCALCGAALPNEDCGHRKNGVSPCCIPATHEGADHILAALAAEGIGLYDTATHAAVPREEATSNSVQESLRDSSYLAGMNAGWNYGISDDRDGYDATLLAFRGYLAPVRSAQKEKRRAHLSTGAEAEAKGGE